MIITPPLCTLDISPKRDFFALRHVQLQTERRLTALNVKLLKPI